jgi:hypothetical protein
VGLEGGRKLLRGAEYVNLSEDWLLQLAFCPAQVLDTLGIWPALTTEVSADETNDLPKTPDGLLGDISSGDRLKLLRRDQDQPF